MKITLADIDQNLGDQGYFCLLDWLIKDGSLPYSRYEDWRYGRLSSIDELFTERQDDLKKLISRVVVYCDELKLTVEEQTYFAWGDKQQQIIYASKNQALHEQLAQHWLRPQDLPQLDLFMDNSAIIAENALFQAMAGRQFSEAEKKLQDLTRLNAKHARLGIYQDLVNYGLHMEGSPSIEEKYFEEELLGLEQEVQPLAQEALGGFSRDFLAHAWRRLAKNFDGHKFDPGRPKIHLSYSLGKIPDWHSVTQSLMSTEELYSQEVLIERLCVSLEKTREDEKAILAWCVLLEKNYDYAEKAIKKNQSTLMSVFLDDYWDLCEADAEEFIPAYIFSRKPELTHYLQYFPSYENTATAAVIELLMARIQGETELPYRQKLQEINPELLRLYMIVQGL